MLDGGAPLLGRARSYAYTRCSGAPGARPARPVRAPGSRRGALGGTTRRRRAATAPAGGPRPRPPPRARSGAQAEFARAEAALRGARALLDESIGEAWECAVASRSVDEGCRAGLRLAATHAATAGLQATETAYRLGGGTAVIHDSSPLQRRLRDVNAAVQHMLVAPATWELTGRLLLGLPTDSTQL